MVDVTPQGGWELYRINKDKDDGSLPFSSFSKIFGQCNFSQIFKRRQLILEPCRNSKHPIRCLV